MRVAIFASGSGSNFQALVESFNKHEIPGKLICLFCDQEKAYVIKRAQKAKVPYFVLPKKKTQTKTDYEKQIIHFLREAKIDLICLAGYMKILGKEILEAYPNRIINIHPSLLPKFKGVHSIEQFYNSSEKETGITIHLVDKGIDTGPIIFQKKIICREQESLEDLTERIHELEHAYYPKVIAKFIRENVER
ncbi:phosphoribosylglycinamide formyltransferase [Vagococcus vulneris]|uniref:Phosphoribosylglycinamide formyltransferase n=1 Tax=Vagococcus vulneris TaxID=1977869 RepID=A0A429ZX50_9ENTE|nr:phosphoribosylglycinamide formyltransferase [Vagococcus vulneris]RST98426.1 phosphoribosylglycinamide formyltransferase [Vagococcus vulneris]